MILFDRTAIIQIACISVQLVILFLIERRIRYWKVLRKEVIEFFEEQRAERRKWYMEAEQKLQEIARKNDGTT